MTNLCLLLAKEEKRFSPREFNLGYLIYHTQGSRRNIYFSRCALLFAPEGQEII